VFPELNNESVFSPTQSRLLGWMKELRMKDYIDATMWMTPFYYVPPSYPINTRAFKINLQGPFRIIPMEL
jgi:hypothetical protein